MFAEESRPPYDRVALTSFFSGRDPDDLLLGEPGAVASRRRDGCTPTPPSSASTPSRREVHARGRTFAYDALVLATGSSASRPAGRRAVTCPGAFVYRTVDDVTELRAWATRRGT